MLDSLLAAKGFQKPSLLDVMDQAREEAGLEASADKKKSGKQTLLETLKFDAASISTLAQSLKDIAKEAVSGDQPLIDVLAEREKMFTQSFTQNVKDVLAKDGVDVEDGLKLTLDANNKPAVLGDNPQKAEIEALLAKHPEITASFRDLVKLRSIISAVRERTKTQTAVYRKLGQNQGIGAYMAAAKRLTDPQSVSLDSGIDLDSTTT